MNKFVFALCSASFISFSASAQNTYENNFGYDPNEYVDEAVDLQDIASRRTIIQPEQYVEYLVPLHVEAAKEAQSLNEKEAKMLISIQNKMNRDVARKSGDSDPEEIDASPTDTQALQEILTPKFYTYDDEPIEP